MRTRTKVLIGATAAAVVGLALATPIINLASPVLSKGNQPLAQDINGTYEVADGFFKVNLTTNRPATIVTQEGAYNPGGENGWHSHPGMVIVTLMSGTIHWYDAGCHLTTYKAGDSWVEGSAVHMLRNAGPTPFYVMATYIVAEGTTPRIDQPEPPCAVALGLN